MKKNSFPKILIIGSLPYTNENSSRPLKSYFGLFPKENLKMIYSNTSTDFRFDLCCEHYQITDYMLFKRFLKGKKQSVGVLLNEKNVSNQSLQINHRSSKKNILEKFKEKNVLRFYLRMFLWKKKRWCTKELIDWVTDFAPDFIYVCFSDDIYILNMAIFFADLLNKPIICQVGDDYFFSNAFSKNLFFRPYFHIYKKRFLDIYNNHLGFGVYISEKIKKVYNTHFSIQGDAFYIQSTQQIINNYHFAYKFNYFGKINNGRAKSLAKLNHILQELDSSFYVRVFTSDKQKKDIKTLRKSGCVIEESISYDKVLEIMNSGSFNIIASGLSKKDCKATIYSLSTKTADCLASAGPILAIGNSNDGAIGYLNENKCAIIIDENFSNINDLKGQLFSDNYLLSLICRAKATHLRNHDLSKNRERFFSQIKKFQDER